MKELSEVINEKISELEGGELAIADLEGLVDDARELYERLLIVKFKAYEKYGEPATAEPEHQEEAEEINEIVEELEEPEVEEEIEEPTIDFSGITEEIEQPSFDFSASEEVPAAEEKIEEVLEEEEEMVEEVVIPKAKEKEGYKDSYVERVEEEDENSLNEKLKDTDDELSLRKKLQSTPVTDIKKEISIAKKFEYITFMFEGRNETYEKAIEVLNNCTDGEDAKNKLNEFSTQYNWDLENKSIIKFVELVERRYL